jgi:asparagine synthase (glutamine-hydrolysing)
MCGITGLVGDVDAARLQRMTDSLRHRGPDADGIHVGQGWGFGHRRLSIIDLSGGAQPMATADERLWITYNGEIYNFATLRQQLQDLGHEFRTHSDTEVLLLGYRQWGEGLLSRLNGMFAFAIWDEQTRRLFVARDRVGIKPLYWASYTGPDGPALAFASEPKALLACPGVSRELDVVALDAYLDLLYVPPPLSMFRGIRQLPPGHHLVWQDGEAKVSRYWDAEPAPESGRSVDEWAEELAPILEDAIAARTIADVPLGAFLSGGVDSSTIVAVLCERGHSPVETFCVGYGAEGKQWDERPVARRTAQHFATNHHEVELTIDVLGGLEPMVRGFDEPFGSPTALLSSALSKYTRSFVTVALAGDGGDEIFGGYPRYRGMLLSGWVDKVPAPALGLAQRAMDRLPERARARAYQRWARQFLEGSQREAAQRYASWVTYCRVPERDRLLAAGARARIKEAGRVDPVADWFDRPARGDLVERAGYADLHGFLPENVLRGSDRMSMAHGLELRVPFCDHRLIEGAMRVPSNRRLGPVMTKRVLRRIMKGRLPAEVLRRPKLGFNAPLAVWLRGDLDRLVGQWLGPHAIAARGLLDATEVQRYVQEHRQGHRDHSLRLWSLIVLEQWCRAYLDDA